MQNFIGQTVDIYRITQPLGVGRSTAVFKAYDTWREQAVALKLIFMDQSQSPQQKKLVSSFEAAMQVQMRLSHPHIVPVFDYGKYEGTPYLVQEYLPGGTLEVRMTGQMSKTDVLSLGLMLADALIHAHFMGVLHLNIKPSNIIFTQGNTPLLTDFRMALLPEPGGVSQRKQGKATDVLDYLAPEQKLGRACEASDQFALGVLLYELLAGSIPSNHQAHDPAEHTLPLHPTKEQNALSTAIPSELKEMFCKALAQEPKDRFKDMSGFKAALVALLGSDLPMGQQFANTPMPVLSSAVFAPVIAPERVLGKAPPRPPASKEPTQQAGENHADIPLKPNPPQKKNVPGWFRWAGGLIIVMLMTASGIRFLSSEGISAPEKTDSVTETAVIAIDPPLHTVTETPLPIPTANQTQLPTNMPTNTPTNTPEPVFDIGSSMINPVDGAVMVYVPEGEFLMGSDEGVRGHEKPQRDVYVDAFWIYMFQVTNNQYRLCVDDGVCAPPGVISEYHDQNFDEHPVVNVSWFDAATYCEWVDGRLPTESEWEKAARGTDGRRYPWGNNEPTCQLANFLGCEGGRSMDRSVIYGLLPVGHHPDGASPYGAQDMAGNAWEWVYDWYDFGYYQQLENNNPTGPESGETRVLRGGAWAFYTWALCTTCRFHADPNNLNYGGFRCVVDAR